MSVFGQAVSAQLCPAAYPDEFANTINYQEHQYKVAASLRRLHLPHSPGLWNGSVSRCYGDPQVQALASPCQLRGSWQVVAVKYQIRKFHLWKPLRMARGIHVRCKATPAGPSACVS